MGKFRGWAQNSVFHRQLWCLYMSGVIDSDLMTQQNARTVTHSRMCCSFVECRLSTITHLSVTQHTINTGYT